MLMKADDAENQHATTTNNTTTGLKKRGKTVPDSQARNLSQRF